MSNDSDRVFDAMASLNAVLLTTDLATLTNKLSNRRYKNEIRKLKRILDTLDYYFDIFDDENANNRTAAKTDPQGHSEEVIRVQVRKP